MKNQVKLKPKFRVAMFFIYLIPFLGALSLIDVVLKNETPFVALIFQATIFGLFMTLANPYVRKPIADQLSKIFKTDVTQPIKK